MHIDRMYNYVTGSKQMMALRNILTNKVITEKDMKDFSEKSRNEILGIRKIFSSEYQKSSKSFSFVVIL